MIRWHDLRERKKGFSMSGMGITVLLARLS